MDNEKQISLRLLSKQQLAKLAHADLDPRPYPVEPPPGMFFVLTYVKDGHVVSAVKAPDVNFYLFFDQIVHPIMKENPVLLFTITPEDYVSCFESDLNE